MDQWTAKSINFLYAEDLIKLSPESPDSKKCKVATYEEFLKRIKLLSKEISKKRVKKLMKNKLNWLCFQGKKSRGESI